MAEEPEAEKKKRSVLTPRRKKFLDNIAAGQNHAAAYRNAGYKTKFAAQGAHILLSVKGMRAQLQEAMEARGYTIGGLVDRVIVPGLQAEKIERRGFLDKFTDEKHDVDHVVRGQFADRYAKLMGWSASNDRSGTGTEGGQSQITINLGFLDAKRAAAILRVQSPRSDTDSGAEQLPAKSSGMATGE